MDKSILVGNSLTDEMIEAGEHLITALEKKMNIKGALWIFSRETDKWKLVIVTPDVRLSGPIKTYRKIQSTSSRLGTGIDVNDMSVTSEQASSYLAMKNLLKTGKSLSKIRLTDNFINGVHIPDALVYRMT